MKRALLGLLLLLTLAPAQARIGLVTVPKREAVQLTIYNSADLTLVREERKLTLAQGVNRLEFSWAETLIDPTSVQFDAKTRKDQVEVIDVSFPAEAPNALVWSIQAEASGEIQAEISYFTSGLTWSADYEALVEPAGKNMRLNSFIKVRNASGEEYGGAQVRLVVGTIHLVENIADLARRGRVPLAPAVQAKARRAMAMSESAAECYDSVMVCGASMPVLAPPTVIREGLSEYFIYTVSGRNEIPDGWAVRWLNFTQGDVPVDNFYRFEEGRYNEPRRFLALANQEEKKLGREPLPDGMIRAYQLRADGTRFYLGGSRSKYVPVGEKWEIDLGADPDVVVKPTLQQWSVDNVEFDTGGEATGWEVKEDWRLEVVNSRAAAIMIEIDRNASGDCDWRGITAEEKYDQDTARFRRTLEPRSKVEIDYSIVYRRGTKARR